MRSIAPGGCSALGLPSPEAPLVMRRKSLHMLMGAVM
jgi:hypothetical protein